MNILNLEGWDVLQLEDRNGEYYVTAQPSTANHVCPKCGSTNLYNFGRRKELVMDLPMHGRRVGIRASRRRFRCRECSLTFVEALPFVDSKHRATTRLVEWIAQQSLSRTFASVADEIGVGETMVKRIFDEHVAALNEEWEKTVETPRYLGIDELRLAGGTRAILTNVEQASVIDLLSKRDMRTVAARISRMPNRERIEVVTIDMWWQYRQACRDVLPQAQVVVDKFHVERMATLGLETVRRGLREELSKPQRRQLKKDRYLLLSRPHRLTEEDWFILDTWTENFPVLKQAWDLKEAFFRVYGEGTPDTAGEMLDAWIASIPKDMRPAFKPLTTAVGNWRKEILAFFTHRVTNAYTEGLNGLAKMANRQGRGHAFETIRAKVLFHIGLHRVRRPGFAKSETYWEIKPDVRWVPARDLTALQEIIQNSLDAYISDGWLSTGEDSPEEDGEG